jgi:hypothetical protein
MPIIVALRAAAALLVGDVEDPGRGGRLPPVAGFGSDPGVVLVATGFAAAVGAGTAEIPPIGVGFD